MDTEPIKDEVEESPKTKINWKETIKSALPIALIVGATAFLEYQLGKAVGYGTRVEEEVRASRELKSRMSSEDYETVKTLINQNVSSDDQ